MLLMSRCFTVKFITRSMYVRLLLVDVGDGLADGLATLLLINGYTKYFDTLDRWSIQILVTQYLLLDRLVLWREYSSMYNNLCILIKV